MRSRVRRRASPQSSVWPSASKLTRRCLTFTYPDGDGFDLAEQLTRSQPGMAVLLTSADFDEHFYARADASGARGFVPKSQLAEVELERFWPGNDRR